MNDQTYMEMAMKLARKAGAKGEVPVGAVVVHDGKVVGLGYNRREGDPSPLAHAELIAIDRASRRLKRWRLSGCTLYVTLEPCVMCAGAIVNSRVDRVVYAAKDAKAGAVESLYSVLADDRLNHKPLVESGLAGEESSALLSGFFKNLRARNTSQNLLS